jgi:5-methyltetrahydrofolate--homocysteine methyltransferase
MNSKARDKGLEEVYNAVLEGDAEASHQGVQTALAEGRNPEDILHQSLIPAMKEVGERFERQEYYVPEMLIAARSMQAALNLIRPLLVVRGVKAVGKVALGTVQGDLHDIGKNLVGMMLEGGGFEVIDLGTDVAPAKFVEVAQDGVDLVAMSALLTTTMTKMPAVIKALAEAGLRDQAKVMIGGAPVTQEYSRQIGADGYAPDASQAVALARALLNLS